MTAIERLLTIAESEVSYPEEESNTGNHNYTKYARNVFPGAKLLKRKYYFNQSSKPIGTWIEEVIQP